MNKIILKLLITIICAIVIILFGACAVFGFLWVIDFFNIPAYIFAPIMTILFLWCIYKEIFGGDNLKDDLILIRYEKEEKQQIKRDAEEHGKTISDYIRYLVAKERKEREK